MEITSETKDIKIDMVNNPMHKSELRLSWSNELAVFD